MPRKKDRQTSVLMELPMQRRDAKRLGVETSACRLVVGPGGGEESAILLVAKMLDALRPPGSCTFIHSVNEFVPLEETWEAGDAEKDVIGELSVVRVCRDGVIGNILLKWEAEAHVVFWKKEETIAHVISQLQEKNAKFWKPSPESYEATYLRGRVLGDMVGFFARSHLSLELIGIRALICESFDTIRKLIG